MGRHDRLIPPGACSWCGHDPHDEKCAQTGCPCAYRKDEN